MLRISILKQSLFLIIAQPDRYFKTKTPQPGSKKPKAGEFFLFFSVISSLFFPLLFQILLSFLLHFLSSHTVQIYFINGVAVLHKFCSLFFHNTKLLSLYLMITIVKRSCDIKYC